MQPSGIRPFLDSEGSFQQITVIQLGRCLRGYKGVFCTAAREGDLVLRNLQVKDQRGWIEDTESKDCSKWEQRYGKG